MDYVNRRCFLGALLGASAIALASGPIALVSCNADAANPSQLGRDKPKMIVSDNSSEFTSNAMLGAMRDLADEVIRRRGLPAFG
jgi:hypothetical protein